MTSLYRLCGVSLVLCGAFFCLMSAQSTQAGKPIAIQITMTSDKYPNPSAIWIRADENGDLEALEWRSFSGGGLKRATAGQLGKKSVVPLSLEKDRNGRDFAVLAIQASHLDPRYNAYITLHYVRDAMREDRSKWRRGEFRIRLQRETQGWKMYRDANGGEEIRSLCFKVNKFMGRPIGIDRILPNRHCPKS